jgi:hypothetical protein
MEKITDSLEQLRRVGVYFYFPEKTISEDIDQYTTMIIVSGLVELGVPCFSNVAHTGLIQKPVSEAKHHCVVLDVTEANYTEVLVDAFAKFEAKGRLIHSRSDINPAMITPENVLSLMTHENRFMQFKSPRSPWAFGLSDKWVKRHANETPFCQRKPVLVRNFRPASAQGLRSALDLSLLPHLEKYFEIDRAHDIQGYPARLANSVGCLAYCGEFLGDLIKNPYFENLAAYQPLAAHRTFFCDPVITRWDSWRFWESLAAGCLTFQLNFETYGFELPEMPVPWTHYVPIDLADLKGSVEQLMDRKAEWEVIANAGRSWALDHYTTKPTARRFAKIAATQFN